jgi:hypothetical protein
VERHILKIRRHWSWLNVIKLGTYICFLKSRWKGSFSKLEPCNIFRHLVGSTYELRPKGSFSVHSVLLHKIIHMLHCYSMLSLNPGQRSQFNEWRGAGRSGVRVPVGEKFTADVGTGPGPTSPPTQCVPGHYQGKAWLCRPTPI